MEQGANGGDRSASEDQAIAVYLGLLGAGLPPHTTVPRRIWNLAVMTVSEGTTTTSLRERTRIAREMGLIDVEPGRGAKKGTVTILPPGHDNQYIPGVEPEELASVLKARMDPEQQGWHEPQATRDDVQEQQVPAGV